MAEFVLDASAVMAVIRYESGEEVVAQALRAGSAMLTMNLAEVVGRLAADGFLEDDIREAIDPFGIEFVAFTADLAYDAGLMLPLTKPFGLSLGDRACLSLAKSLGLPALTADRAWANLPLDVDVRVIR